MIYLAIVIYCVFMLIDSFANDIENMFTPTGSNTMEDIREGKSNEKTDEYLKRELSRGEQIALMEKRRLNELKSQAPDKIRAYLIARGYHYNDRDRFNKYTK